jgi:hypothetical protein
MPGDEYEKFDLNRNGQRIAASTYLPLVEPTSHGPDIMRLTVLNGTTLLGNMTTSASQCSLYWCVKTLEAEVVNGRFSEHELDSWYDKDARFGGHPERGPDELSITAPFMDSMNASSPYVVGEHAHLSLGKWFESTLVFSDSLAPRRINSTTAVHELRPDLLNNFTGYSYYDNMQLFVILRQVRDFGSAEMVSNLAKAITTYVRTLNASEQNFGFHEDFKVTGIGPANGTAYNLQVSIHVRWRWISFTGIILFLTIVFFVLTVTQSTRHGIAAWKSSPLALLFHGLDAREVQHSDADDVANMHFRAKNMRVRLRDTASGVKLENEQN